MTTIEIRRGQTGPLLEPAAERMVRTVLLLCGVVSSLLYVATDILGGLRYRGYSFASQAISELMAVGAQSATFVDPLFMVYGVLMLAFGVGVYWEAERRERALRIAGVLLAAYAVIGLTGPTLFAMHPRGTGTLAADVPHIILTGVLVLLLLLAIGFGAVAFGKRFRGYSYVTLLLMLVLGTVTSSYSARLAAGLPTPGLGIVERIDVYASLLWIAVLAVALVRRSSRVNAPAPA